MEKEKGKRGYIRLKARNKIFITPKVVISVQRIGRDHCDIVIDAPKDLKVHRINNRL